MEISSLDMICWCIGEGKLSAIIPPQIYLSPIYTDVYIHHPWLRCSSACMPDFSINQKNNADSGYLFRCWFNHNLDFCLFLPQNPGQWHSLAASICLFPQTQQKPNQDLATMGQLLLPHMAWQRHRHARLWNKANTRHQRDRFRSGNNWHCGAACNLDLDTTHCQIFQQPTAFLNCFPKSRESSVIFSQL